MKRYSIFHVPVLSFFSRSLYYDVCHRWKGTGFGYLFLLLAVCWIVPIVKLHERLSAFVENEAPKVVSQIPVVTIAGGRLSIDEPQPYYIYGPDMREKLVVIDATGAVTSLEDADTVVLITETGATFKKSDLETRTISFREIDDFSLDQETITNWLRIGKSSIPPVFYVFAVLGSFSGRIVQILVYGGIGLVFASMLKSRLAYTALMRIAVVAVTPCILVKTVLSACEITVPFAGFWYFLAAMFFLFFGVKAASQDEASVGATDPWRVQRGM